MRSFVQKDSRNLKRENALKTNLKKRKKFKKKTQRNNDSSFR